jgi:hypothetical protein
MNWTSLASQLRVWMSHTIQNPEVAKSGPTITGYPDWSAGLADSPASFSSQLGKLGWWRENRRQRLQSRGPDGSVVDQRWQWNYPYETTSGANNSLCLSQIPNYMRIWSLRAYRFAFSAVHLSVAVVFAGFKSRAALQVENLALRRQLGVLHRSVKRPNLTAPDRLLWHGFAELGATGVPH